MCCIRVYLKMSGFSSRSEDVFERQIDVNITPVSCSEEELIEKYNLNYCIEWINQSELKKVCLQFPDSFLNDSVAISIWFEKYTGNKYYILGDSSYGSCCVDEVAAEHINADGIIHFGHTCLSLNVRLPVLFVFPKLNLDIRKCISVLKDYCNSSDSNRLVIFDVEYTHYIKMIQDEFKDLDVIYAENVTSEFHESPCSSNCCLFNGNIKHSTYNLGRGYCLPTDNADLVDTIFIGDKDSRFLYNYRISCRGNIYRFTNDEKNILEDIRIGKTFKHRLFHIEKLKDADSVGVIIGTLGIKGFLEAIKRVCDLIRRRGKKCYVISVGKPTVAKLANFSEIQVYVMISCPEAVLNNEKEFYQPILTPMEAEIALNEGRSWSDLTSNDFKEILPGGKHYVDLPDENPNYEADVSLVTNKIRYNGEALVNNMSDCNEDNALQKRSDMTVENISSSLSNRSWRGLDPMLGQVPIVKAVPGRSGIAQGYSEEKEYSEL